MIHKVTVILKRVAIITLYSANLSRVKIGEDLAMISNKSMAQEDKQMIIHTAGDVCATKAELMQSAPFTRIVELYLVKLKRSQSPEMAVIQQCFGNEDLLQGVVALLQALLEDHCELLPKGLNSAMVETEERREVLHQFVEGLYNFWRSYDRFMVIHSELNVPSIDKRPYRYFNRTIERLTEMVRSAYRDVCENITGKHPRIYRQVAAGCNVGLIAVPKDFKLAPEYKALLEAVPFIRQVWIAPPMIIDPPMNTRTGRFNKVDNLPIDKFSFPADQWICYPACVGSQVVFVYFHQRFIGLGSALANLFELASDEQIKAGPHALYFYGVDPQSLAEFGELPTVFYDDDKNGILVGAVPGEDRFGYFGYLKKMILTLHNAVVMKQGRMPFHGALVNITLKAGKCATILLMGDTATGKSECLEAFRLLGESHISSMKIIADDMGSVEISAGGDLIGYGTEIGAFVRLDDLAQGYAFGQIDRAIIMSPQKVNARVVLPVSTIEDVIRGYRIDYILYANNYELVEEGHPVLERFEEKQQAIHVFREGAAMAKGTTTSTGLVHSYFANIFGAPQYRELHEGLAQAVFEAAFKSDVFVGQLRTRLAVPSYEMEGPQAAAQALFDKMVGGIGFEPMAPPV